MFFYWGEKAGLYVVESDPISGAKRFWMGKFLINYHCATLHDCFDKQTIMLKWEPFMHEIICNACTYTFSQHKFYANQQGTRPNKRTNTGNKGELRKLRKFCYFRGDLATHLPWAWASAMCCTLYRFFVVVVVFLFVIPKKNCSLGLWNLIFFIFTP